VGVRALVCVRGCACVCVRAWVCERNKQREDREKAERRPREGREKAERRPRERERERDVAMLRVYCIVRLQIKTLFLNAL
jgi:hypothetical protein